MTPELVAHRLRVAKTARYFAFGEPSAATREIWIACHGYAQRADSFARTLEPIVSPERCVVAPEGLHRFYLDPPDRPAAQRRVGATWMTREERDSDIADYIEYLDRLSSELRVHSPAAKLVALGFSQGAATIARWAVASTIEISRVILWGSGLPPDLDWDRARERFAATPLVIAVGDQDRFVTPERLAEEERLIADHGIAFERVGYPGGHAIEAEALKKIAALGAEPSR